MAGIAGACLAACLLALGSAPAVAQRELITNDLHPDLPDLYTADLDGPDPGLITGELTWPGAVLAERETGLLNPDGCTLVRDGACLAVTTEAVVEPLLPAPGLLE